MKKFILCFAAGLTALSLGLGIFYTGQYLVSSFQSSEQETGVKTNRTELVEPAKIPVEELIYPKPVVVEQKFEETEKEAAKENYEFYPGGSYYIIGDAPKGFENCKYFTIETSKLVTDSDGSYIDGFPIPPKGYFTLGNEKEIAFTHLSIANKEIAFETERKGGISYQFVGKFIGGEELEIGDYTYYVVLIGKLTKLKNGKKISEQEVKFGVEDSC